MVDQELKVNLTNQYKSGDAQKLNLQLFVPEMRTIVF